MEHNSCHRRASDRNGFQSAGSRNRPRTANSLVWGNFEGNVIPTKARIQIAGGEIPSFTNVPEVCTSPLTNEIRLGSLDLGASWQNPSSF